MKRMMMMGMMSMAMKSQRTGVALWTLGIFLLGIMTMVTCGTTPLNKRSLVDLGQSGGPDETSDLKFQQSKIKSQNKRTFCNAFTGCGRKRNDGSMPLIPKDFDYEQEPQRDSSGDSSDDGALVDDIARDILAEARLWEALQARSSMRNPYRRQPGFFPKQKRDVNTGDKELTSTT